MGAELEGLTVGALAGESAKAKAGAEGAGDVKPATTDDEGQAVDARQGRAGMTEGGEGGAPWGAASAGDQGEGGAQVAAPVPAEVQALVDAQVKAAVEGLRAEYEGKDGHLSKLRSKKDKEIARLQKMVEEREQAEYEEALKLARSRPGEAVERLAGMVDGMQSRRRLEQQEAELQAWADTVLENLGLDPDDEAVAEVAAKVGPLAAEGASYAFLGEMGKLAREQEAAARKAAEKELASTLEGLPGMISAAVAKQLAASGIGAVDGAEQQAPAVDNVIKDVNSPSKLMAMGWKAVGRRK